MHLIVSVFVEESRITHLLLRVWVSRAATSAPPPAGLQLMISWSSHRPLGNAWLPPGATRP